jgi:hypothetical protein
MGNYSILAHGFLVFNQSSHVPKGRFFLPAGKISFIFRNAPLLAFAVGPDLRGLVLVSHAFINSPSDFIRLYKLRLRLCMRPATRHGPMHSDSEKDGAAKCFAA